MKKFLDILKRTVSFILRPILQNPLHFFMAFILASGFAIVGQYLMKGHNWFYNIETLTMWGLIIAYVASAVITLPTSQRLKRVFVFAIYFVLAFSSLIDIVIYAVLGTIWNENFIGIIAGTNAEESKEFIQFYVTWKSIGWVLGWTAFVVLFGIVLKIILRRISGNRRAMLFIACALCGGVLASSLYLLKTPVTTAYKISLPGKVADLSYLTDVQTLNSPELTVVPTDSTARFPIFLIIGESHSSLHSQMYGYPKATMPRLSAIPPERLVVFRHIEAPATVTEAVFRKIMTTTDFSGKEWNESNTVIQLMDSVGYNTIWLSNQSRHGAYDNYLNRFATLSDSVAWTGDAYSIADKRNYDSELLDMYRGFEVRPDSAMFFVFHFMGSHVKFPNRYPKDFSGFDAGEYSDRPELQREVIANYDTSVLFTDSVLNELFKEADLAGAPAIYFSDHALDLYDTNPTRVGNADLTNLESVKVAKQIPFMVYIPESFEQKYPGIAERIRRSADAEGCTDHLFFTLMDLTGVSSPQWPEARSKSLFNAGGTKALDGSND